MHRSEFSDPSTEESKTEQSPRRVSDRESEKETLLPVTIKELLSAEVVKGDGLEDKWLIDGATLYYVCVYTSR